MRIVFKRIPKLAIYFYGLGFLLILISLMLFFNQANYLPLIRLQQLMIAGAVIVAIGSVINNLYQFKLNDQKNSNISNKKD